MTLYHITTSPGISKLSIMPAMLSLDLVIIDELPHLQRNFAVRTNAKVADILRGWPTVQLVERDRKDYGPSVMNIRAIGPTGNWGLDRIDQRSPNRDGIYHYTRTGSRTDVYIIDTGITLKHNEFQGTNGSRARALYDPTPGNAPGDGVYCVDEDGHGTHVGGIAAGANYGIASDARVYSSRIFGPKISTTTNVILQAINAVVGHHNSKLTAIGGANPMLSADWRPSVVNCSWNSTGIDRTVDEAIIEMIRAGITVVVSAGNHSDYASNHTPASAVERDAAYNIVPNGLKPIVVGSVGPDDSFSQNFSNSDIGASSYVGPSGVNGGSYVDILAPGEYIYSSYLPGTANNLNASVKMSGTSMAAPHVTGVAALVLDANPAYSPTQIRDYLIKAATVGAVIFPQTSKPRAGTDQTPNILLYSPFSETTLDWNIDSHIWSGVGPYLRNESEGAQVSAQISAKSVDTNGATRPVAYNLISGSLPSGLVLTSDGVIQGNISSLADVHSYNFTVEARDGVQFIVADFVINVSKVDKSPYWVTPGGFLANPNKLSTDSMRYKFSVAENVVIPLVVSDPDSADVVNLTINQLNGQLPPGISFEPVSTHNNNQPALVGAVNVSATRAIYEFTFRVTDGTLVADQTFKMEVFRDNNPPNWAGSSNRLVGTFTQGQLARAQIEALDPDNDPLIYGLTGQSLFKPIELLDVDNPPLPAAAGNDAMPTITVSDSRAVVGPTDTNQIVVCEFQVELFYGTNSPFDHVVRVAYQTSDGTAQHPADYVVTNGIIEFDPTEYYQYGLNHLGTQGPRILRTISVPVRVNYDRTSTRFLFIDLSVPVSGIYGGNLNRESARASGAITVRQLQLLPDGISLNSDGKISGIVAPDASPGEYSFEAWADDQHNLGSSRSSSWFRMIIQGGSSTADIGGSIVWKTRAGYIGTLEENQPCFFVINAVTTNGNPVTYTLSPSSGPLPPGIELRNDTGELFGVTEFVNSTTNYNFIVRGFDTKNQQIYNDRTFIIRVRNTISGGSSKVEFAITGNDRLNWFRDYVSETFIGLDYIFRPNDPNYGYVYNPRMYLLNGVPGISDSDFWRAMDLKSADDWTKENPKKTTDILYKDDYRIFASTTIDFPFVGTYYNNELISSVPQLGSLPMDKNDSEYNNYRIVMSDAIPYEKKSVAPPSTHFQNIALIVKGIKSATARDENGNPIYELLYWELYDANEGTGGFDRNGNPEPVIDPEFASHTNYKHLTYIYPKSISNMRKRLTEVHGLVSNTEPMPLWMRSWQTKPTETPGFIPAIPIAYLKPGMSQRVLTDIAHTFKRNFGIGTVILIDRLLVTKFSTSVTRTSWDKPPLGSFETLFDNDRTSFDRVRDPDTSTYFKFAPGEIEI